MRYVVVLIHSAMGGVGQAALAIVRLVGAQAYLTAGTVSKRQMLIDIQKKELEAKYATGVKETILGVFDSSNTTWYTDMRRALAAEGKEGVNIVLNSLAGNTSIVV